MTITMGLSTETEEKKRKHFGRSVKESFHAAREDGITHIVEGCVKSILQNGLKVEGVLRVPGNKAQVYHLKDEFDQGKEINYFGQDPFDLGGLLKLYLYELPDSLFPENLFKEAERLDFSQKAEAKEKLQQLVKQFPPENLVIFQWLMKLFSGLIENAQTTKMSPGAIVTSIGPSIFLSPNIRDDPVVFLTSTESANKVGVFMVENMTDI
eukprot:TRINITY_DN5232_c0_g1_i1.p1 TRINITY_DN5232_c0_g1~~TRINITY_DN5232_c0_g1_i1.p1  ORF type:complete len:210 (+),score=44.26 TRINITY_DN5232_c0_g1_i1:746-1375(+)